MECAICYKGEGHWAHCPLHPDNVRKRDGRCRLCWEFVHSPACPSVVGDGSPEKQEWINFYLASLNDTALPESRLLPPDVRQCAMALGAVHGVEKTQSDSDGEGLCS